MGLQKQYLKYGQTARDKIFGLPPDTRRNGPTPLSMLISHGAKFNNNSVAVIILGIITLIVGVLLSSIPWIDYFILKNLRLWNNTLSFHYWQRPGVIRLTKVYIFNVTNPDGFLNGEKPKLVEIGPFVYREDMEKVNIKFHDNYTVTYQHKKILQFVPELSIDRNLRVMTPNIPLLTLSSQTNKIGAILGAGVSFALTMTRLLYGPKFQPFISVSVNELLFGYEDTLVNMAHTFYPRNIRPDMSKMGLLLGRNGTLTEVSTINTGHNGMEKFGYLDQLNGQNSLPFWDSEPCTDITASEGSFFPPREYTKSDIRYVYDKDLCRILPLEFRNTVYKDGIPADLYGTPDNIYGDSANNPNNSCFDTEDYKAARGLQNISPCQYSAPVYISNPHFYLADPALLDAVDGLKPNQSQHETYFKIQPKLGVPLEGKVRVQLNLKVDQSIYINSLKNFRSFMFPIIWVEEGIAELTPSIRRWIYLATVFGPAALPILSYSMILAGSFMLMFIFVRAYKNFVFHSDPTVELLEMGRRSLRRGSSLLVQHQHRIMMHHHQRDSYMLLKTNTNDIDLLT
ncbi:scavenger receptor class B member 1 [Sitodiplosis mosellana]|uniref:scavenger receptor class B member 1 n=1 Tax=Sitodiplosis mosellana TaxID=263140 RepID=UPI0024439E9E|nr:scavenger receptor class B member 1 [Sitodiplosis mosellana]XP_055321326.1 scavenger receptor class B member 1 [Sitodiplosis mosellana]XP_055321327.1 scavenger receptor class B member 1 [Sitodiplosis mosellana]